MELIDYLRILRRQWIPLTAMTIVGLVLAAGGALFWPKTYATTAKVLVTTSGSSDVNELQLGSEFAAQRTQTYAGLATTPAVLTPVIEELDLRMRTSKLAESVEAEAVFDTTLIEITVESRSPAEAAQIANAICASLTTSVEQIEAESSQEQSMVLLTTVQEAEAPVRAKSPNPWLTLGTGLVAGLAVGLGVALLREGLDRRLRGTTDLADISDAPVIGSTPDDPRAAREPIVISSDPQSIRAEAFRSLRANLQFLEADSARRVFVITSAVQAEGKSTTTANLAAALSEAGRSVLVIDADLRRPTLAGLFSLSGSVGLTDVLIGRADLADAVQRWGRSSVFVLPSGPVPPNPSELLGLDTMGRLVDEVAPQFDVVLIDSPPLLAAADAAILARLGAGVLMISATRRVARADIEKAIGQLERARARLSGFVLTRMPHRGPDRFDLHEYGSEYRPAAPAQGPH